MKRAVTAGHSPFVFVEVQWGLGKPAVFSARGEGDVSGGG